MYSCIYIMVESGSKYIKIGKCKDRFQADKRVKSLQTGNPRYLYILALAKCEDVGIFEKIIHELFEAERVRGEWFLNKGRVSEFISRIEPNTQEFLNVLIAMFKEHYCPEEKTRKWQDMRGRKEHILKSVS